MRLCSSSRTRLAALLTAGVAFCLTSCSVGVQVQNDSMFQTQWSASWSAVNKAAEPWNASGTLPGVCNKGGSASDCVKTDEEVITALQSFVTEFDAASFVPRALSGHVADIVAAVRTDLSGLEHRDTALKTDDNAMFTTALAEFGSAATGLKDGYNSIAAGDRPLPLPFNGLQVN